MRKVERERGIKGTIEWTGKRKGGKRIDGRLVDKEV